MEGVRIFTAVGYFQAKRTIGAKLLSKSSPSVFSYDRIRSWEKNTMGPHIHRCQSLDPAKTYLIDLELKSEFLKITHVAVTFSKLTDMAGMICTKRPYLPL